MDNLAPNPHNSSKPPAPPGGGLPSRTSSGRGGGPPFVTTKDLNRISPVRGTLSPPSVGGHSSSRSSVRTTGGAGRRATGLRRNPRVEKEAERLLLKLQRRDSSRSRVGSLRSISNQSSFLRQQGGGRPKSTVHDSVTEHGERIVQSDGDVEQPQQPTEKRWNQKFRAVDVFCVQRVVLICLMIGYTFLGGALFYYLEHEKEREALAEARNRSAELRKSYARNIWDAFRTNCIRERRTRFGFIALQINRSSTECNQSVINVLESYHNESGSVEDETLPLYNWDFWNAMFFSITIYTTIGYGNMTIRSDPTRVCVILYAVVGIPLMLICLNHLGKWGQRICARGWLAVKRYKAHYKTNKKEDECSSVTEGLFPIWVASVFVVMYIFLCGAVFILWEDWGYFTSLYFFFITLSTVGFGDVMPKNPKAALAGFILIFFGLALVSMIISHMQERMENKYLAALEMIEDTYMNTIEGLEKGTIGGSGGGAPAGGIYDDKDNNDGGRGLPLLSPTKNEHHQHPTSKRHRHQVVPLPAPAAGVGGKFIPPAASGGRVIEPGTEPVAMATLGTLQTADNHFEGLTDNHTDQPGRGNRQPNDEK